MDRPRAFGPVAPWPSAACGYWQPGARHPLSPPSPPTSALLLLLLYVRAYSFHHGRRHLSARRAARHGARVLGFPPFANLPRTAANRGCARSMRLPRLRAQLHALPHCHVPQEWGVCPISTRLADKKASHVDVTAALEVGARFGVPMGHVWDAYGICGRSWPSRADALGARKWMPIAVDDLCVCSAQWPPGRRDMGSGRWLPISERRSLLRSRRRPLRAGQLVSFKRIATQHVHLRWCGERRPTRNAQVAARQ